MNLRPHRSLKPGRYVLDVQGRLHPFRRRYHVEIVAVVHVKAKAAPPAREQMVDFPGVGVIAQPAPLPRPAKIDLSTVPSEMERRADSWRGRS